MFGELLIEILRDSYLLKFDIFTKQIKFLHKFFFIENVSWLIKKVICWISWRLLQGGCSVLLLSRSENDAGLTFGSDSGTSGTLAHDIVIIQGRLSVRCGYKFLLIRIQSLNLILTLRVWRINLQFSQRSKFSSMNWCLSHLDLLSWSSAFMLINWWS